MPFEKGNKLNNNASGARDEGYKQGDRWINVAVGSMTNDEIKQMWASADAGDEHCAAAIDRRNRALSATGCKVTSPENSAGAVSPEILTAMQLQIAQLIKENIELKAKRKVSKK